MSASDFPHPSLPSHSQHLLLPHVRHISPPFLCRGVKHYTPSTRLCSLSSVPFLSTSTSFSPASLPIIRVYQLKPGMSVQAVAHKVASIVGSRKYDLRRGIWRVHLPFRTLFLLGVYPNARSPLLLSLSRFGLIGFGFNIYRITITVAALPPFPIYRLTCAHRENLIITTTRTRPPSTPALRRCRLSFSRLPLILLQRTLIRRDR
ncbi:hypothetical protein B0H13DRAFT_2304209 [Mycena leptocephala]|nr:hypothetical protein B0H13DRAFT_2304209 [Mycena leptocephala]